MRGSLSGTRIRQRRRSLGVSQKDLAVRAEISPSYLNLIEHNRRAIGGRVLNAIARALDMPVRELAEGPDHALFTALQEAAADADGPVEGIEDLVARFPHWSRHLAELQRANSDQTRLIETLGDRLTHDPYLSESLHLMLSSITAIRSTASLMTSVDNIPAVQSQRFNQNIHTESLRLSDAAQALVSYFEAAADKRIETATPEEEFDRIWAELRPQFGALEAGETSIDALTAPLSPTLKTRLVAGLEQYLHDAKKMPLAPFLKIAIEVDYAPDMLAAWAETDLHAVFRRLSVLPEGPEFGLIEIDGSGHIQTRRPLTDFPLPRHTSGCTLWPLYQCLQTPGRALQDRIKLPDGKVFQTYALSRHQGSQGFGAPQLLRAAMLIRAVPDDVGALPAGIVCRLCTRQDCDGRSEPPIMGPI